MKDFNSDYAIASKQIEKAVEAIPQKLIKRESSFDKNLNKSQINDTDKLKKIYQIQEALAEKMSPATQCHQGCSHCCHYNVDILDIEAQLIEDTYDIPVTAFSNKQAGNQRENANFHGQACGFLKDNQCSIYDARPFMCRKFASFMPDDYWCQSELNLEIEMPHIAFSEINLAYARLIDGHSTRDIRQWFPSKIHKTTQEPEALPFIEIQQ